MATTPANNGKRNGIFEGFEGYRTIREKDYSVALNEGMLVPDTNVLLSLYRYTTQSRDDLVAVLEKLGDRLWVPNHVVKEFWRNRETVLEGTTTAGEEVLEALSELRSKAAEALRHWARRTALEEDRFTPILELLEKGTGPIRTAVEEIIETEEMNPTYNTNEDPILAQIEKLLTGRVGQPFSTSVHNACIAEGRRRIEANEPPGYKDKNKKGDERSVGDYILWAQLLAEAEKRRCDVLLVTNDVKEDWWHRFNGQTRGPRHELVNELHSRAGVRLFMLTPENLLRRAMSALEVPVSPASVEDVERVDRSQATENDGWSIEGVRLLLVRLATTAPVQHEAMLFAAANGGIVSREKVYEIGGYEESRTLRGFTRPPNRMAAELRDYGLFGPDTGDALETMYDSAASAVLASGFTIPEALSEAISRIVSDGASFQRNEVKVAFRPTFGGSGMHGIERGWADEDL